MQTRNIIFVIGLLLAGGLLFLVITTAVDDSIYMLSVERAVNEQGQHEGRDIKVQGNVVPGSIQVTSDNSATFQLTRGGETIQVRYTGARPDTFKDCADVIVTGRLHANLTFDATDMIAKCPSKYDDLPGGCESAPEGVMEARPAASSGAPSGY